MIEKLLENPPEVLLPIAIVLVPLVVASLAFLFSRVLHALVETEMEQVSTIADTPDDDPRYESSDTNNRLDNDALDSLRMRAAIYDRYDRRQIREFIDRSRRASVFGRHEEEEIHYPPEVRNER